MRYCCPALDAGPGVLAEAAELPPKAERCGAWLGLPAADCDVLALPTLALPQPASKISAPKNKVARMMKDKRSRVRRISPLLQMKSLAAGGVAAPPAR
jgi:hypothetical protein